MRTSDPHLVEDLSTNEVLEQKYDLFIGASGHETRARFISEKLIRSHIGRAAILGFESYSDAGARRENDQHFDRKWGIAPTTISTRSDDSIYGILSSNLTENTARVLIDYSSMTRFWYAAILNWMRFQARIRYAVLDFVYTRARYATKIIPRLEIDEILCIPGCEGSTAVGGGTVALIGLGFDNDSVQCVLDDIEPDVVIPFMASGTARSDYVSAVRSANQEIASRYDIIELPLESVAATCIQLAEIIAPFQIGGNVSIVPLGPKPHVLASVLLSMRFPRVACLHVSGKRQSTWDAHPEGDPVCTRVIFRKQ